MLCTNVHLKNLFLFLLLKQMATYSGQRLVPLSTAQRRVMESIDIMRLTNLCHVLQGRVAEIQQLEMCEDPGPVHSITISIH